MLERSVQRPLVRDWFIKCRKGLDLMKKSGLSLKCMLSFKETWTAILTLKFLFRILICVQKRLTHYHKWYHYVTCVNYWLFQISLVCKSWRHFCVSCTKFSWYNKSRTISRPTYFLQIYTSNTFLDVKIVQLIFKH